MEPLVKASPDLVKQSDAGGATLLHHAAGFGTVDTLTFLIDRSKRTADLRVELEDAPGSPARAAVVGGK